MPQKGFVTQCLCVLFEELPSIDEVATSLGRFDVLGTVDAQKEWAFGGPSVVMSYRPEVNGRVAVDIVSRAWPDGMGDPVHESALYGAWAMGQFGPGAYPGGLERACDQAWAWPEAPNVAKQHAGFMRVRSGYAWGQDPSISIIPDDYSALAELVFLTNIIGPLLSLQGATCFFNPNGEVLRDHNIFNDIVEWSVENKLPPLELWSNIRVFKATDTWMVMDTVGNGQLDLPDAEACFLEEAYECQDIDTFLRNITLEMIRKGQVFKTGDTLDGPGSKQWRLELRDDPCVNPPRHVIRAIPLDGSTVPDEIA